MRRTRRLLLTLTIAIGFPIAGARAQSPPTQPPPNVPHVLKVTHFVNFGQLPVGTCPLDSFPGNDAGCAAMLRTIHVINISDQVVDLDGETMNQFGFGMFNVDIYTGDCDVLQPGGSCDIAVFGHVLVAGVSWTYLSFFGACDENGCTDFAWVRLQVEGL